MAHPKRPRNYAQALPRKVRALGMRIALSSKVEMGLLRVVPDLNEAPWEKTGEAYRSLIERWEFIGKETEGEEVQASTERAEILREVDDTATTPQSEPTETSESRPTLEGEAQEAVAEGEVQEGEWILHDNFGPPGKLSILFLHSPDKPAAKIWEFARPLRNIQGVEVMSTDEVEVYHMLKYRWLVMEGEAVDAIGQLKGQVRSQGDWEDLEEEALGESEEAAGLKQGATTDAAVRQEVFIGEASVLNEEETTEAAEGQEEEFEFDEDPLTADPSVEGNSRLPRRWIIHKWRKHRGAKSMRKTFGTKNATEMETQAKRAWKRLKREGVTPSADLVAAELAKRKYVPRDSML